MGGIFMWHSSSVEEVSKKLKNNIINDTIAASPSIILPSYVFIIKDKGIVSVLNRNVTADIVTIEFKKKNAIISLIVILLHGIITSFIILYELILQVLATTS